MRKTFLVTLLCGAGHVGSSIAIGMIGILLGMALSTVVNLEGFRGNLAAWALIAFGLVYMIWGLRSAWKHREHAHTHADPKRTMTVWVLFTIFVLGPCEPLIPMLMYPAYQHNIMGTILDAVIFSLATITTMMTVVLYLSLGLKRIELGPLERYTHAMAGGIILVSGLGIQFLGL